MCSPSRSISMLTKALSYIWNASLSGILVWASVSASEKPNILFLFADDWGRHASAYAAIDGPGTVNDVIQTPNFDALAKEGVLFDHAYVSAPSCTPCRSSLLSGQHFWRTGTAAFLHGKWDFELPAYPLILEENGYHIGFSYKVWAPGVPRDAPHGGARAGFQKAGSSMSQFSQTVTTSMEKDGLSVEAAKDLIKKEVVQNFQDFLAARDKGKPFCYWFGPTNVHRKWVKGSGKAIWGMDPNALEGKMPSFLPDVHEVREDLNDYLGEAVGFDMAIGILIEQLKAIGEYDNTIIAISGDHGAPGFPHGKCNLYDFGSRVPLLLVGPGIQGGRIVSDFASLPDLAPTFLEAGGCSVPDAMTAKSLWPVLKSNETGLVDASRTQSFIGRERHYYTAREDHKTYPQRAVRTKEFLYVINFIPERTPMGDHFRLDSGDEPTVEQLTANTSVTIRDEDAGPTKAWIVSHRDKEGAQYFQNSYGLRPMIELYDMKKDPDQMKNVASDPAYAEQVKLLHSKLMKELRETEDPRVINDGEYFEELSRTLGRNSK